MGRVIDEKESQLKYLAEIVLKVVGLPALFRGNHMDDGNLGIETKMETEDGDHLISQLEID